ncbi:hypothetical protein ELE36_19400 [Pseudolysobacter antarcticus]|uniref:Uncharacterized protein n=1 Tax=Pseudolysobacter antarcticus TaxID=2511995 RepID=A0A411HPK9_9GAMM|nr:hypothetical protein [Pseudolysobacter antarcticus]QBB72360.1 hypothetical protein ELE36_19400 [Pseudolysobacter antarcticus]
MSRFILLLAALALSGCVVQPPNYVRYDAPAPEGAYADNYANRDARPDDARGDVDPAADSGNYADRARDDDTASGYGNYAEDQQGGDYDDDTGGYADVPDYIEYPAYYSSLWPVYGNYYYPYASPYFYPGVTFYPSGFYGAGYGGFGWGLGLSFGFGFSPWRSAYWDNYYNWGYWRHNYPNYGHYYPNRRFGSARNEAARVASFGGNRGSHGFSARGNSINSRGGVAGLPTWGGQRAGVGNSRVTQGNAQQRSSGFAGQNGALRNSASGNPGDRAANGNSYGERGNARAGYSAGASAGNRPMPNSPVMPSASYRDQSRGGAAAGLNNRREGAAINSSSPSRQQNYSNGLRSSSQYSGAAQNYSSQQRAGNSYRSQPNYRNSGGYAYRGSANGAKQSYTGGYMAHEYASPKADHSAAPRGYMSGSRGGFQGPYGGGGQASRGGGEARSSAGRSSSGARSAPSSSSRSSGSSGHRQ